jgi:hypothetical protein
MSFNKIARRTTHAKCGQRRKGNVFLDSQRLLTDYSTNGH